MTTEQIQKREKELNQKCMECRRKYGTPSYDHCEYHCQVGNEMHKLDFERQNGFNSHKYWKETR